MQVAPSGPWGSWACLSDHWTWGNADCVASCHSAPFTHQPKCLFMLCGAWCSSLKTLSLLSVYFKENMADETTEGRRFLTRPLTGPPVTTQSSSSLYQIKENATAAYNWFGEMYLTIIWRALVANLILLAITLLAVFLYGSLYYTYIPQSVQRRQLYFQRTQIIKVWICSQLTPIALYTPGSFSCFILYFMAKRWGPGRFFFWTIVCIL